MRKKAPILPLSVPLALIILLALWSPPQALTQERNIGVTSSQAGAVGYHALVIGNNDYQSIPKLKTAEADAKDVESVLEERYGFQTSLL